MTDKPEILKAVDFDFTWDSKKVWALKEPVQDLPIEELTWHFEYPFLDREGTDDWNLTPQEVMGNPTEHLSHYEKVKNADLSYPIDIMENKGRWRILDGLHRLMKAYMNGQTMVEVRIIPRERIPEITRGE